MAEKRSTAWRVNEIVIASVIAVACALVFALWNLGVYPVAQTLLAATAPQLMPLIGGGWLIAGTLGAYLIRKPGAALYCELLAALISVFIGPGSFGLPILISGLIQGVAAELIFAIFLYRAWNLPVMLLAGAASGFAMGLNEVIIYYAGQFTMVNQVIYVASGTLSGLVIAGLLMWLLARALGATGVLDSLASGRSRRAPSVR
ncbi:ECF transporter S component [Rothia endophytica]|uniref:ECF transporter S component n=1 Tax=Rothia endophytica TaxID=1324766 RepID=UPI001F1DE80C|nr:ECF transporter S component [Rothia endophytica]